MHIVGLKKTISNINQYYLRFTKNTSKIHWKVEFNEVNICRLTIWRKVVIEDHFTNVYP